MSDQRARIVAFYLPQFHPIPLNDEVYGVGFTEWTHLAAARPLYRGHHQPIMPGELGFYDLRVPEVRAQQAELARTHGVEGFCYWHYWSDGQRLIERPFQEVLESGEPDLPFCLGWANHAWDDITGRKGRIFDQKYPGPADWEAHFRAMEPAFHDPRHIRVGGHPLFYLFRPAEIPDIEKFCESWREMAASSGLGDMHFVGQMRPPHDGAAAVHIRDAMDAVVYINTTPPPSMRPATVRLVDRLRGGPIRSQYADLLKLPVAPDTSSPYYPCLVTNWDNTPRWGRKGEVVENATPELFGQLARRAVAAVADRPLDERIIFVKSWNEWAEGNHLEPDAATGRARLEAVAAAVR